MPPRGPWRLRLSLAVLVATMLALGGCLRRPRSIQPLTPQTVNLAAKDDAAVTASVKSESSKEGSTHHEVVDPPTVVLPPTASGVTEEDVVHRDATEDTVRVPATRRPHVVPRYDDDAAFLQDFVTRSLGSPALPSMLIMALATRPIFTRRCA